MPTRNRTTQRDERAALPMEPIGAVMHARKENAKAGTPDETETLIPDFVHQVKPSSLIYLPIEELFVDYARDDGSGYARALNEYNIKRIMRKFNANALAPAIISDRGDNAPRRRRFAVIDGQHRIEVARRIGLDDYPAEAKIGLTVEEEAALYTLYGVQYAQTPGTRFRARLAAGPTQEPDAHRILEVCKQVKLTLDYDMHMGEKPMSTRAFVCLERAYHRVGGAGLYLALLMVKDFWGDDPRAFQETVIHGISAFNERYYKVVDRDYLAKRMRDLGLSEMFSRSRGVVAILHGKRPHAFGRAMQLAYNEKLSEARKLPEWVDKFYLDDKTGAPKPARPYRRLPQPTVRIAKDLTVTRLAERNGFQKA